MIRLFIRILAAVGLISCEASVEPPAKIGAHEASMNFDSENVRPFLERINTNLEIKLNARKLARFARRTRVGEERSLYVEVLFQEAPSLLEYRVFKDDIDAPDLYFFSDSGELISAINEEYEAFAAEMGI
ncbi:MAG: hypothetical protein AAFX54_02970 [Pseudomonadota bacterium]